MKTQGESQTEKTIRVSFDGHGFNDANNEYKERIATLSEYGKRLPKFQLKRIESAVNNFDRLLEACKDAWKLLMSNSINESERQYTLKALEQAITQAEKEG